MDPRFFSTPRQWRKWLETHHATERELWVGLYKRKSGKPSITWPESVDEALCFGWIDGLRKGIDDLRYAIRFTPRKTTSTWSTVNIRRVAELQASGRMRPAGQAAFDQRTAARSGIYSYEQGAAELARLKRLSRKHEGVLKADSKAWAYFRSQPPWYRRASALWINSARREETRLKRLDTLVGESARHRPIPPLRRKNA